MTIASIALHDLPFFGRFGRKPDAPSPAAPDPQLADLRSAFETFRASQEQHNAGLQEQLKVEREERRRTELANTKLVKELSIQKGYSEMLQGSLKTVTEAASGLANDISSMRTLLSQADERLKWQADTIDGLKTRIIQLEDQLKTQTDEKARLTDRLTVMELRNELLTEENAEFRAAASGAGVDLATIERRISERRNQAAQRSRDNSTD